MQALPQRQTVLSKIAVTHNGPTSYLLPLTPQLQCNGTLLADLANYSFDKQDEWVSTFKVGQPATANGVVTVTSTGTVQLVHNGVPIGTPVTQTVKAMIGTSSPRPVGTVKAVYAGSTHTCAVTLSNLPYCWGGSTFGQIGDNDSSLITKGFTPSPRAVSQITETQGKTYSALSTGGAHTCGVVEAKIICWGGNGHAQIGVGTTGYTGQTPLWTAVPMVTNLARMGSNTPTQVDAGGDSNCAIASGKAYCWGFDGLGQTGSPYDVCAPVFSGCLGFLTIAVTTPKLVTGTIAPLTTIDISTNGGTVNYGGGATNSATSCAVDSTGKAHCWGSGDRGQLGRNSTASSQPSVAVLTTAPSEIGSRTITDISVGVNHVCAITNPNGELFCWGDNTYGQIGINSQSSTVPVLAPKNINAVSVLNGKKVTAVATGDSFTCAVADNKTYCWGANTVGQLGLGFNSNTFADPDHPTTAEQTGAVTPTLVNSTLTTGKTITQISAKGPHACEVADFYAYCWGLNSGGQLGNGTQVNSNVPVAVISKDLNVSGRTASDISMGSTHTCAVSGGKPLCWGQNSWGQLGNGEALVSYIASPTATSGTAMGTKVTTQISASRFTAFVGGDQAHTCAIADGDGYCWGSNLFGQLGSLPSDSGDIFTPQAVKNSSGALLGKKLIDISTGYSHTCAVGNDHRAYCWGGGLSGQHGNGFYWNLTTDPTPVSTTSGDMLTKSVSDIDAGYTHTCAIAEDKVYCWGSNGVGQLGIGTTTASPVPKAVTIGLPGQKATSVTAGANYSCAVVEGTAYCWGKNDFGQLGQPIGLASSTLPLPVGGILAGKNVSKISAGGTHTCAIADGDAYCWGLNDTYQLGNGTTVNSDTPVKVQKPGWLADKAISNITAGGQSSCLIADLKPYCWGANSSGQLGDTTISIRSAPSLVFSFETLTSDNPGGGGGSTGGGFSGIIRF